VFHNVNKVFVKFCQPPLECHVLFEWPRMRYYFLRVRKVILSYTLHTAMYSAHLIKACLQLIKIDRFLRPYKMGQRERNRHLIYSEIRTRLLMNTQLQLTRFKVEKMAGSELFVLTEFDCITIFQVP
jgi:hypothetical protein